MSDREKMGGTMQDDLDRLHEALLDLGYEIAKGIEIIWLARRLGLTLKPWVIERERRHGD